ncbi:DeoR/GlpR family DNA-binding transcription regulator [Hespellia stercorisuis]|uniref:Transcriptional regulator, DeoR family n=1 Tax=Hespellia stercorisuis DSM 15480 TaxID=1121950 RepID=A0A1M6MDX7_9FIRM|nr:DeoR/GlpR family DNA-binding transcription regulator [Hespellia stercorisuis]SHJ81664.1 transcriptional regulator, DeoR family [Hespellia stercorisuis DSM 15480]
MREERREIILQELKKHGKIRVADLSKRFQCSEVTVRNDIRLMDKEGLLVRVHGGAVPAESAEQNPEPYKNCEMESLQRHAERKRKIAACAYAFIKDRDTIIIDDASASYYLAEHIRNHPEKRVIVVTNSLPAGNILMTSDHVELFMVCGYVGGYAGGHLPATLGDWAVRNIGQFHVDKAFIGVHGINFEVGFTSVATLQMEVKKAIIGAAKETYVLADSSKFGGGYLSVVCPLDAVRTVITDDAISSEDLKQAENENLNLVIA